MLSTNMTPTRSLSNHVTKVRLNSACLDMDLSKGLKKIAQDEDAHLYLEYVSKIFDLSPTPVKLENLPEKHHRLKIVKS